MNRTSINPGRVEWCGENPFIQLQEGGSVSALALFFRIVLSPYGRGCAGLVLGAPHRAAGWPDAPNLLMTDNQRLLRWIVDGWVNGMPAFRDLPGLGGMTWIDLEESLRIPDPAAGRHTESLSGAGVSVELIWDGLGAPFAVEAGETGLPSGPHDLYAVLAEATDARVLVDGEEIPGQVAQMEHFGRSMKSAQLALSVTWVASSGEED